MEWPQRSAVKMWTKTLSEWVVLLKGFLDGLVDVRTTTTFARACSLDRFYLDATVRAVIDMMQSYGPCFEALGEYAAGMACFACEPEWVRYVWRDSRESVVGVSIASRSCVELGRRCEVFMKAQEAFSASHTMTRLTQIPGRALPSLFMFSSREALCDWAATNIALRPFPGHSPNFIGRQMQDVAPLGPTEPDLAYDAVRIGAESGIAVPLVTINVTIPEGLMPSVPSCAALLRCIVALAAVLRAL